MNELASLQTENAALRDINLPRLTSIDAAVSGDRTILVTSLGRFFRNPICRMRWDPKKGVEVESLGRYEDFMSMLGRRNDAALNSFLWAAPEKGLALLNSGLEVSNVGISIAPVTELDGASYAILARRRLPENKSRLMLISGYTDARKFFAPDGEALAVKPYQLFVGNAAMEGAEELLLPRMPGWFSGTRLTGKLVKAVAGELAMQVGSRLERAGAESVNLSSIYDSLDYDPNSWWKLSVTKLPPHIHNVFSPPAVTIDGVKLNGVGVQQHMHTNSGQLIFGARCTFPLENRELFSLLHAEDGPLATPESSGGLKKANVPPDMLATRLDRYGLILARLDEAGQLTPNFYNFFHGELKQATHLGDLDTIMLSDAFVPSALPNIKGLVDRGDIPATEYFKLLGKI